MKRYNDYDTHYGEMRRQARGCLIGAGIGLAMWFALALLIWAL